MPALWFPANELKADVEDQARQRLEEMMRRAQQERDRLAQEAQQKLKDQRLQEAQQRLSSIVDPVFKQVGDAVSNRQLVGQQPPDTNTEGQARSLVEQSYRDAGLQLPQGMFGTDGSVAGTGAP